MKLVDASQMESIDHIAQERYGIPDLILMENAGIKAYVAATSLLRTGARAGEILLFLAGKGNNGGDALVMARQAHSEGRDVRVVLLSSELGRNAAIHRRILQSLGVQIVVWDREQSTAADMISGASVLFDGLLGTGLRGRVRETLEPLLRAANDSSGIRMAIDVPSGVGDGFREGFPAIAADYTLCLGLPKRCLYLPHARKKCGTIIHVPIGFPTDLTNNPEIQGELLGQGELSAMLPEVPPYAYKNTRGKLAVFAGSSGTTGAAVLCSEAALRAGTGLVYLFIDKEAYGPVASQTVSVMPRPWDPEAEPGDIDLSPYSAVLAGPGWGFENRWPWLHRLIGDAKGGVLDADALTLLARHRGEVDLGGRWVLTPHPGEAARLAGVRTSEVVDDVYECSRSLSRDYQAVVVLKGHVTIIASPTGRFWVVDGMNPAMGTGGSGDVLAGMIAGLMARGIDAASSARLGVLAHDRIGKRAAEREGWFTSRDLLPYVSFELGGSSKRDEA